MSFLLKFAFFRDFIKDLFFDTKEEGKFLNSEFNPRKFTVFILVIVLLLSLNFLINVSFKLFKKNEMLKADMLACHCIHKEEVESKGAKK